MNYTETAGVSCDQKPFVRNCGCA